MRTLNHRRLIVALVCLALVPLATEVAALVSQGVITAICAALILYEVVRHGEARERVRAVAS